MELRIRTEDLKKIGITTSQYLMLWGLYNQVRIKYFVLSGEGIQDLNEKGYIGLQDEKWLLIRKGIEIFEPPSGIFDEFIELFPTRVKDASGIVRVLSPESTDSLSGQKLRKKWHAITKTNVDIQEHIVKCLKEEVKLRKREGSLYWMRNAETWLNKATWEDYEYLLENPKEKESRHHIGEIKL
jgi:hypothetical protein